MHKDGMPKFLECSFQVESKRGRKKKTRQKKNETRTKKDICMCVYVDKYARKRTIVSTKHVRGKKGRQEGDVESER